MVKFGFHCLRAHKVAEWRPHKIQLDLMSGALSDAASIVPPVAISV